LDQEKGVKKMDEIGLSPANLEAIRRALKKPYGLILISGPTGSGKTTTLYSMLEEIDREHQNVLSLEDPIEYNIEGMSQSQVRPDIDYTFATGLRTTLRQDPDVIMVGEIRDKETAQLAIQAALTGHLVLSTIHTNSAIGVIPRLVDMGVDPYLIAPTLILAIAQRLVSAIYPKGSGKKVNLEGGLKVFVDEQFKDLPEQFKSKIGLTDSVYEAEPSDSSPSGKKGRMAVMEVLEMDKEFEELILKDPTEISIGKLARSKGMITMREDALLKSMRGEIPFEEVNTL
jgi:type II secretory ATPase GspE/PulE/Tfp pilus assembly ATPase PilB-like protein